MILTALMFKKCNCEQIVNTKENALQVNRKGLVYSQPIRFTDTQQRTLPKAHKGYSNYGNRARPKTDRPK